MNLENIPSHKLLSELTRRIITEHKDCNELIDVIEDIAIQLGHYKHELNKLSDTKDELYLLTQRLA